MDTYRIVVGVDGSDGGRRALDWSIAEAVRHGGAVQAVAAWRPDNLRQTLIIANDLADPRCYAEQVLNESLDATRAGRAGVAVHGEVVRGEAARVLVDAAQGADLLVVGSHGHGRLRRAVLGSVAEASILAADCPVVVVPVAGPTATP